jgi:hypothetical protein
LSEHAAAHRIDNVWEMLKGWILQRSINFDCLGEDDYRGVARRLTTTAPTKA